MGKLRYLSVLFFLLALLSCKKEEVERQEIPEFFNVNYENPQLSGTFVNVDVRGRVLDFAGNSLSGALVEIGNESTTTDEHGFYEFDQVAVDKSFALIRVSGGNHFNQFRNFVPATDRVNTVDIRMVQRQVAGSFQTSSGGVVQLPGGGRVIFNSGALIKADGSEYTGEVSVYSAYLDPTDPEIARELPGSLAAVDNDGDLSALVTYGMLSVELESSNGIPLQLADGEKAELKFPIQEDQLNTAPESIDLWFFDEASGIWREDGMATIENGEYVGEVSHFTWWNCDVPYIPAFVEGRLKLGAYEYANLSNLYVRMVGSNGVSGITSPDGAGYFSGLIPINENVSFYIGQENCSSDEELVAQVSLGEGDSLDLGELEVPTNQLLGMTSFQAQLRDCQGNPIVNGVLNYVLNNGMYGSVETYGDEGLIEFHIFECQETQFEIDLAAFESGAEDLLFTGDTLFYIDQEEVDLGELNVCNIIIPGDEHFSYSDGVNSYSFGELETEQFSGCYKFTGGNAQLNGFVNMGFNSPDNQVSTACLEADLFFPNESNQRVEVQFGSGLVYQFELFQIGEEFPSGNGVTDLHLALGTFTGEASVTVYQDLNSEVVVDTYVAPATGEFFHEVE